MLQRNRRYSHQKEMITAECTRNIEMAKNQFEQQSAGSACAGRVHEPWVGLQAFVDGSAPTGARLRFVAFPINFLRTLNGCQRLLSWLLIVSQSSDRAIHFFGCAQA